MSPRIRAIPGVLRRNAPTIARDIAGTAGVGLIVAGVSMFSFGLAMIAAGAIMVAIALRLARNG